MAGITAVRNAAEQRAYERLLHPGLGELWTGSYDLGYALARGNARTETLTNSFNATRITRKDKITVSFSQIYGTALVNNVSSAVASALRGGWTYNRDFTPRFFVSTLNTYEHDRFQSLDLRFVAGGGLGINAIKTEKANLSFSAAATMSVRTSRPTSTAIPARRISETLSSTNSPPPPALTQAFQFYPNLTYTGQYRCHFRFVRGNGDQEMAGLSRHGERSLHHQSRSRPPEERPDSLHRLPPDLREVGRQKEYRHE